MKRTTSLMAATAGLLLMTLFVPAVVLLVPLSFLLSKRFAFRLGPDAA